MCVLIDYLGEKLKIDFGAFFFFLDDGKIRGFGDLSSVPRMVDRQGCVFCLWLLFNLKSMDSVRSGSPHWPITNCHAANFESGTWVRFTLLVKICHVTNGNCMGPIFFFHRYAMLYVKKFI